MTFWEKRRRALQEGRFEIRLHPAPPACLACLGAVPGTAVPGTAVQGGGLLRTPSAPLGFARRKPLNRPASRVHRLAPALPPVAAISL